MKFSSKKFSVAAQGLSLCSLSFSAAPIAFLRDKRTAHRAEEGWYDWHLWFDVRSLAFQAERKATNKYYPPEWDPSKGSLNTFHGQHHLRERAKKIHEGILVVRFEMPFDVWCSGCGEHVGKGVRYNAEKKAVGKYFSSKIWNFRMKCHLCDNYFEIETDPKANDYVCKSGLRKKNEEWQAKPEDQVAILPSEVQ